MASPHWQLRRNSGSAPERCVSAPEVFDLHVTAEYHDLTEDWVDEKHLAQEEVRSWLEELGLVQYCKDFYTEGLDDLRIIEKMGDEDVDEIASLCHMPRFHRKHLVRGIAVLASKVNLSAENTARDLVEEAAAKDAAPGRATELAAALARAPTPFRCRIATDNDDDMQMVVNDETFKDLQCGGYESMTRKAGLSFDGDESSSGRSTSICSCASSMEEGQQTVASSSDDADEKVRKFSTEYDEDAQDDMYCQGFSHGLVEIVCSSGDAQLKSHSDASAARNPPLQMPYSLGSDEADFEQEEITLDMLKHWGSVKVF